MAGGHNPRRFHIERFEGFRWVFDLCLFARGAVQGGAAMWHWGLCSQMAHMDGLEADAAMRQLSSERIFYLPLLDFGQ